MTFRDPTTRYQTPNELIAELEPLCAPLTRDAVQAGETNDWESQELRIVTGESSQADIQDAGYQQFLREMDSGAAVDLMTVSGGGGDASISGTLPVIDRSTASAIRKTRPRGRLPVGVVAGVTAAIAVTGIVIALSGGDSGTDAGQKSGSGTGGTQEVAKPLPVAVITKSEPASVIAGESVSVQTQLTIRTAPVSGQLVFALGKSAPASASISEETGQVTWDVPQTQTPLDYHLPVEVYHQDGNTRRLVTSEVLTIRVLPSQQHIRFRKFQSANHGRAEVRCHARRESTPAGSGGGSLRDHQRGASRNGILTR